MQMKYTAIVTYATNESIGVVVCADSLAEAWKAVLEEFGGGGMLQAVRISHVISPAHNVERWG